MERAHDTMMNPPIEELLDRVDSKFGLVTLAARRARQHQRLLQPARRGPRAHGAAAGQLVARKPLSIGFEEIAADKIKWVDPVDEPEAALERRRGRRRRRSTTDVSES